jgi:hypothetical protein
LGFEFSEFAESPPGVLPKPLHLRDVIDDLVIAAPNRDLDSMMDGILQLCDAPPTLDRSALRKDMGDWIDRYASAGAVNLDMGGAPEAADKILRRHRITRARRRSRRRRGEYPRAVAQDPRQLVSPEVSLGRRTERVSMNMASAAQAARLFPSRRGWFHASRHTNTAALS